MASMDPAYVYLPDDEPDDTLSFGGGKYVLQPNQSNQILAWTPERAKQLDSANLVGMQLSPGVLLAPQGVPPLYVAKHFSQTHAKWGVCVVSGPVESSPGKTGKAKNSVDQAAVDKAEETYRESTKQWAEKVLLSESEKNERRKRAGLKEETSVEGDKARKWLLTYGELATK